MQKVIVTGVGGPAGKAAAAYFQSAGFSVTGTDCVSLDAGLDDFHVVPPADSPTFPAAFMSLLRSERPLLVVPTVTEELPHAARLKSYIRDLGIALHVSDPSAVEIAGDKYLTARTMAAHGIPVPRTLSDDEAGAPAAGRILGYPFIAKPRHGRGGRGVSVIRRIDQAWRESRKGVVFQEFLPGDEYDVNLFAARGGRPTVMRVLLKTALRDGIVGNALSVRAVEAPDIASLAGEASSALRLEGPVDIDIRRDRKGAPKIIEINARIGAHVLKAGGIFEAMLEQSQEGLR